MNTSVIKVLILTPLKLEYEAVSRHLADKKSEVREGALYEIGQFRGKHHNYTVVIREPGMKNTDMALATERAIQHWSVDIAILCGIAGGIKDVQMGDVAIAKSVFNYDSGKESEDGFLPRPVEYHFSEELLAYAQLIQRSDDWKKRASDGAAEASVHISSVAAGDKVVAAVNNATYERITQFLSHCKFLEMEAAGFGLAVQRHRNIHALVIRGISDMCAGKGETDKEEVNWQERAAERAGAVAMAVLEIWQGVVSVSKPVILKEEPSNSEDIVVLQQGFRKKISSGNVDEALTQMMMYTAVDNKDVHNQLILLSNRLEALSRKTRLGVLSNADAGLERAQIVMGVLELVDEM